jgi:hypothetical protein
MKKLFFILIIVFANLVSSAQDGVYGIIKTWRKSHLVSVFNSTHDERYFIGDFFCLKIDKNEKIKEGNYNFVNSEGTKVFGELFIYDEGRTILYEFYVDKIVYSDGRNYSTQRFVKPTE